MQRKTVGNVQIEMNLLLIWVNMYAVVMNLLYFALVAVAVLVFYTCYKIDIMCAATVYRYIHTFFLCKSAHMNG